MQKCLLTLPSLALKIFHMIFHAFFVNSLSIWMKFIKGRLQRLCASLIAQLVKNPLAMHETLVRFLGWEDPLGMGMATQFSILAWRIPWTEESGRLQCIGP